MPSTAIESQIGNLWRTKQSALGTIEPPAATTMKLVRKDTDDSLKAAKTLTSEEYVDGKSWGSPGMVVDTVGGDVGSFAYQVQIETGGVGFAAICGTDVVTGTNPNFTHTITTAVAQGLLQTIYQKVGSAVGPFRQSFWDAKVNKLTFTAGQDQKFARITENILALKAAAWFTTDPTAADAGTDPFNWNEVTGSITVNSIVLPEAESETLEMDRQIEVHRGDSAAPACFIPKKGMVTRSVAAILTDVSMPIVKTALWGTTTPTDGLAISNLATQIPITSTYTRNVNRSLQLTNPAVVVDPADFEIGPHPEGGKIPVVFGGRCLESGGTTTTVVAKTGDSAAYI